VYVQPISSIDEESGLYANDNFQAWTKRYWLFGVAGSWSKYKYF